MASPLAMQTREHKLGICTAGVVSFLNARPLWRFLARREGLTIIPGVPSSLAALLADGRCDIALMPVVDHWRARRRLARVSNACIASDGETMTVRVFSRRPPDQMERLHVDADSHTSIVLARLIWLEQYGRKLELIPWNPAGRGAPHGDPFKKTDAVLLIGDKVISNAPQGFPFEIDLGAAWKALTGLPFVFAAWYGNRNRDNAPLAQMLEEVRDAGVAVARQIAEEEAPERGWPANVAVKYLCERMRYTITDAMRAGMDRFFTMAYEHELLG
jgi:chorismate dehydratase